MQQSTNRFDKWQWIALGVGAILILFLSLYNLTDFPTTWFDEGSHLHVPKTLVRYGVYADYSSEGFRYFGPTIGVGPTVMLPIAAVFELFGIGLLQARLVMVVYLLLTIVTFYLMAKTLKVSEKPLGSLALIATALFVTSRGIALLETGRQLLGEVPGLFFILAGLALWFSSWEHTGWRRLIVIGFLFGLGLVTKYQYLLIFGTALALAWIANLIYYRATPQRTFLIPGIVSALGFGAWQVYSILYLGPATASENFALLRQAAAGAATAFSPELMIRALGELVSAKVFFWAWIPALIYGAIISLRRTREGQQWGVLYLIVAINLAWYVLASISWIRYAFLGLAIASIFVARFFIDVVKALRSQSSARKIFRCAMVGWLAVLIIAPLVQDTRDIVAPPFNAPAAMAQYLDAHVARTASIETWEPEMGFLTDHHYHFPPAALLPQAVAYIWLHQAPPAQSYVLDPAHLPNYILVGAFARWVNLYSPDLLASRYKLETHIGEYELYTLN